MSGVTAASILPLDVQSALLEFYHQKRTGQIALNFKDGQLLSSDRRHHNRTSDRFCNACKLPISPTERWSIRGQKMFCQSCSEA